MLVGNPHILPVVLKKKKSCWLCYSETNAVLHLGLQSTSTTQRDQDSNHMAPDHMTHLTLTEECLY